MQILFTITITMIRLITLANNNEIIGTKGPCPLLARLAVGPGTKATYCPGPKGNRDKWPGTKAYSVVVLPGGLGRPGWSDDGPWAPPPLKFDVAASVWWRTSVWGVLATVTQQKTLWLPSINMRGGLKWRTHYTWNPFLSSWLWSLTTLFLSALGSLGV